MLRNVADNEMLSETRERLLQVHQLRVVGWLKSIPLHRKIKWNYLGKSAVEIKSNSHVNFTYEIWVQEKVVFLVSTPEGTNTQIPKCAGMVIMILLHCALLDYFFELY